MADNVKITSASYANAQNTLVLVLLSTGETWFVPPNNGSGQANVLENWVKNGGNIGPFVPPVPGGVVPVGTMVWSASQRLSAGWLPCDGTAVKRVQYSRLFTTIGTTFGAGDGSTTFNLPDLTSRFVRGWGPTNPLDADRPFGSVQDDMLGPHVHRITDPGHTHAVMDPGHTHAVIDPGHNHSVVDPKHTHGVSDPGHQHVIFLYEIGYLFLAATARPLETIATPGYTPNGGGFPPGFKQTSAELVVNASSANVSAGSANDNLSDLNSPTGITVDPTVTNLIETFPQGGYQTRPYNLSLLPYIKY
jgi:microcystin-dependent protein